MAGARGYSSGMPGRVEREIELREGIETVVGDPEPGRGIRGTEPSDMRFVEG